MKYIVTMLVITGCYSSIAVTDDDAVDVADSDGDSAVDGDGDADTDDGTDYAGTDTVAGDEDVILEHLFPLAVGNTWEYSYESSSCGERCDRIEPKVEKIISESQATYEYLWRRSARTDYLYFEDGELWFMTGQEERLYMALPLEDGATWEYWGGIIYQWSYEGAVRVPAGNFDDCWTRAAISGRSSDELSLEYTYCPKVGKILEWREWIDGDGVEQWEELELIRYDLY